MGNKSHGGMQAKIAQRRDEQQRKTLLRNYPIKCYLDLESNCTQSNLSLGAATNLECHGELQAQVLPSACERNRTCSNLY